MPAGRAVRSGTGGRCLGSGSDVVRSGLRTAAVSPGREGGRLAPGGAGAAAATREGSVPASGADPCVPRAEAPGPPHRRRARPRLRESRGRAATPPRSEQTQAEAAMRGGESDGWPHLRILLTAAATVVAFGLGTTLT